MRVQGKVDEGRWGGSCGTRCYVTATLSLRLSGGEGRREAEGAFKGELNLITATFVVAAAAMGGLGWGWRGGGGVWGPPACM